MNTNIDAKGMTCPKPVILAKKAMDACKKGEKVCILVDNQIAVENLRKLAASQKADYWFKKKGEKEYEVVITVQEEYTSENAEEGKVAELASLELESCQIKSQKRTVVVLSSDKMGEGEEELGKILIKGFVYALTQLEELPDSVLLYNSGAFLSCEDSPVLEDLKLLEEEGVRICTCGTCLDFYKLKEKLAVGEVVNMYQIVQAQAQADLILKP